MARHPRTDGNVHRALDTVRFGASNILNLRESLPTAADASARAEAWLRQRQVEGAVDVLVISGRGKGSEGGISPVREAIVKLIASLRRRGVIDRHEEHTAGSFNVKLAPIRSMVDAPRRKRQPHVAPVERDVGGLRATTRSLLRELAERSLDALGIKPSSGLVDQEMMRQLSSIEAALPTSSDRDASVRSAIEIALSQTL